MSPRTTKRDYKGQVLRTWWRPPMIFNDSIINFFNTYIANNNQMDITTTLTSRQLLAIFNDTVQTNMFNFHHHFITNERYFIDNEDTQTVTIICPSCKLEQALTTRHQISPTRTNQHFTFGPTMVFSLLELKSIWCAICTKQLFTWYKGQQCPSCNSI